MKGEAFDWALCLHEAAHAVTAEILRPGCVFSIEVDVTPGKPTGYWGTVYGAGVDGVCEWRIWDFADPDSHVAIAAGREGEKIAEYTQCRLDGGDRSTLRACANAAERQRARRRAASIVKRHELAIRRVAKALQQHRSLTGDQIRAAMGRFA